MNIEKITLDKKKSLQSTIQRSKTGAYKYRDESLALHKTDHENQNKPTLDSQHYCVSCLAQTVELIQDEQTIEGFKLILGNDWTALIQLNYIFCNNCRTSICKYLNFRDVCINSVKYLTELIVKNTNNDTELCDGNSSSITEYENVEYLDLNCIKSEEKEESAKNQTENKQILPFGRRKFKSSADSKWCSLCNIKIDCHWVHHFIEIHLNKVSFEEYKCKECDKVVKKPAVVYHFETHLSLKNPIHCEVCGKEFMTIRSYRVHVDKHLSYECHHCGKRLSTRKLIQNHIQQVHFGAKRCYHCAKIFHDETEYWAHMELEKRNKKVKKHICDICGYTSNGPEMMWHHKHKKHSSGEVKCNNCDKQCSNWVSYLEHRRNKHREKTVECELCAKKFLTKGDLHKHVKRKHETGYDVACDMCGKFYNSKNLQKHKFFVHLKKPDHCCQICDRSFKTTTLLKRHMFSHAEKRPYYCNLCQTGYYRTDYLKNHYSRKHGVEYNSQEVLENCIRFKLDESD